MQRRTPRARNRPGFFGVLVVNPRGPLPTPGSGASEPLRAGAAHKQCRDGAGARAPAVFLTAATGMPTNQRPTTPGAYQEIWRAATRYIDEHLAAPLSVDEIARAAVTSRRQLQRVFAAVGSTTVRAYTTEARMRRSAALLRCSDAPLSTIAAEVGYRHASAFINAFGRHHGHTPNELRQLARSAPPAVSGETGRDLRPWSDAREPKAPEMQTPARRSVAPRT